MNPFIQLAPIKGVTDRVFRNMFAAHFPGVDSALAPFIIKGESESRIKSLSPEMNPHIKTVPQILSKSSDDFTALAVKLADYGCCEVNWNLGCPFAMVVKRGEGAAMLQYPEAVASFLERVIPSLQIPLSVKVRLGMYSSDEIMKIIPVFNSFPIKEITVHPRIGEQMYDGETDISAFKAVLEISSHPLIYNGDIKTADDYKRLSDSLPGVKGWMIGRGLIGNPFLAMKIKGDESLTGSGRLEKLKNFADDLFDAYVNELHSPAHVLDKMKGVWFYLSGSFSDSRKTAKRIRKTSSLDHYRDEVNRIFGG
jgi:tRNA-dihydrouridine synthase B